MNKNPQKIIKDRYQVVPRSLILVFQHGKVLLQKGAPTKKIWAGRYNGLGGHVEKGEDVLSSAKRELFEEAGIQCEDLRLFGMVAIDVEQEQGILMFVFSGKQVTGTIVLSDEGTLEWVDLQKVKSLPVVEDIPLILDLIGKHQSGDLFFGHYSYDSDGRLVAKFNHQR